MANHTSTQSARVLFFAPFGSYTVHHQLDAVVASALRNRGAEVAILRCDGVLGLCDQFAQGENSQATCKNCRCCGDPFFEAFHLPIIQLKLARTPEDHTAIEEWISGIDPTGYMSATFHGLPIGNWCTSSLCSYYRITTRALNDPATREATALVHRKLLVSGALTALSLSRIIAHTQPSHMFCFNARYAAYRVAFEVARAHGVEVITHERGYADDTFTVFSNYGSIQTAPAFEGYQVWKDTPLVAAELERTKQYFVNREMGTDSNFEPFIDFKTEYATVRDLLKIPRDARILGVFTSSEYEFDLCADYKTFVDQLDLIERLMRVFRDRPTDYLVVRHHPYLGGNPSSLADHGFISRAYDIAKQAPPNVRFIMPGERLNSYALINNLDGAIAFLSTAGIEAVARGVATASFKESLYRDALTTVIEDDGIVYLNRLVDELMKRTAEFGVEDLRRLYRFQTMLISKLSNRFETFGIKDTYACNLKVHNFSMIHDGGDEALDRVCDHILSGKPLLPQPTPEHRQRSVHDENDALATTLGEILQVRAKTRSEARCKAEGISDDPVSLLVLGAREVTPLGLGASRYTNVEVVPVDLSASGTYADLLNALRETKGNLISVGTSQVDYDEAFFSHGVYTLSSAGQTALGVLCGAWVRNGSGQVIDQIFSKRSPEVSLERIKSLCPALEREPYRLLSLALVRREAAISFLEGLGDLSLYSRESLDKIYHWLIDGGFVRSLGHGVLLHGG
jgi:hypothetical protein